MISLFFDFWMFAQYLFQIYISSIMIVPGNNKGKHFSEYEISKKKKKHSNRYWTHSIYLEFSISIPLLSQSAFKFNSQWYDERALTNRWSPERMMFGVCDRFSFEIKINIIMVSLRSTKVSICCLFLSYAQVMHICTLCAPRYTNIGPHCSAKYTNIFGWFIF